MINKSKKLLQTIAAAGAITATGAIATTAHADAQTPANSAQATTDAQSQLTNLKSQQVASEAAKAADNQAQMSQATSAANTKIDQLNDQLKANQASQAAADSAALASGTAQINADAKKATDTENASYSQAVKSQQAANSDALANAAKHLVTPAQKQAQTATENTRYQQAVDAAKTAHDQNNAKLKSDYDAANQKISDQIKNVQDKQSADQKQKLANATAKVDGQINDATKAAQDANAKVSADQAAVKTAQDKANSAKTVYDNAVSQLNNAKENNKGNQQLSTDYPQLFVLKLGNGKNYIAGEEESQTSNQGHWTDTDPVDQATKLTYDANGNLSEKDQIIANVFAANIINYMREQIGTTPVKVSIEGINVEKQLLELDGDSQGTDIHHTIDAGQQLENNGAIITYSENALSPDASGNSYGDTPTVADLKNQIYNSILRWINEEGNISGDQFGHRFNILGVNGYGVTNPTLALGLFERGGDVFCDYMDFFQLPGTQHYVSLANNGQSTTTPSVDLTALQQAVDNAKSALDNANAELTSAKSQLATDQAASKTANDKLAQLKANRDQAIKNLAGEAGSVADQVAALQKQATELANSYQAKVKAENDSYNQKLADLKAEHEKKLDAINKQPSDVNQLKAQLDQKLADLKAKHEANLKKINDDAQAKIDALKKQIADNDAAANKPILDQIAQIKADLANKQAQLDQQLADLKAKDEAAYTALHDQLYPKSTAVISGNSNVYQTKTATVIFPTNSNNKQSSATLPQTGNNNSVAVAMLGAFASMLGFGLISKKREL